jgi:murein DD-endopeptidase MepM/ murein hydrolase activator NlpD
VAKRFTILLIPEGTHSVARRFSLNSLVLPVLALVFVGALALSGYWFHQYRTLRADLPDYQALQEQNQRQAAQIDGFATRLASFQDQMGQLQSFNHRLRVMANLEAPGARQEAFGVGGPEVHAGGVGVKLAMSGDERRMLAMQRTLDRLSSDVEAERSVQKELARFLTERKSVLASTPSIWPVRGWVTSGFGHRTSPFTGRKQFHAGMDISTRSGTPIIAPADGVVTFAGREGGYGRMVVLNHGQGLVTRYGHLKAYKVKKGDKVKRGDTVGLVGSSGRSSGPHLHYEVLMSGLPTNPRYYILD